MLEYHLWYFTHILHHFTSIQNFRKLKLLSEEIQTNDLIESVSHENLPTLLSNKVILQTSQQLFNLSFGISYFLQTFFY